MPQFAGTTTDPASAFSCKSRTVTLILSARALVGFTSMERFNPLKTQSTTPSRQSSQPLSFKNGNKPPAIFDSTAATAVLNSNRKVSHQLAFLPSQCLSRQPRELFLRGPCLRFQSLNERVRLLRDFLYGYFVFLLYFLLLLAVNECTQSTHSSTYLIFIFGLNYK